MVYLAFYCSDTQKLSAVFDDNPDNPDNLEPSATNLVPEIPAEYRDLADVFSETKADELPPHRGPLDHSIPLEEGAKPSYGPIYNLSEIELQTLKQYIDTQLPKGFIRPSTSPYGAPVLFVKKPHYAFVSITAPSTVVRLRIATLFPLSQNYSIA
jgi:hypothetical protein